MTIKEIAELCGVDKSTVHRWLEHERFLSCEMQLRNSIKEKISNGSPENPADLTLEETIAIIRAGGNETLAALLMENAANKDALTASNGPPSARIDRLAAAVFQLVARQSQQEVAKDPREGQFADLEKYVRDTLEPNRVKYKVFVYNLYRDYIKKVENPLSMHVFMYKIAMEHPEFKLKYAKGDWYFDDCWTLRLI